MHNLYNIKCRGCTILYLQYMELSHLHRVMIYPTLGTPKKRSRFCSLISRDLGLQNAKTNRIWPMSPPPRSRFFYRVARQARKFHCWYRILLNLLVDTFYLLFLQYMLKYYL